MFLHNKYMPGIYQLPNRFVPSSYHVRIFPLAIEANKKRKRSEHDATEKGEKGQEFICCLLRYF